MGLKPITILPPDDLPQRGYLFVENTSTPNHAPAELPVHHDPNHIKQKKRTDFISTLLKL